MRGRPNDCLFFSHEMERTEYQIQRARKCPESIMSGVRYWKNQWHPSGRSGDTKGCPLRTKLAKHEIYRGVVMKTMSPVPIRFEGVIDQWRQTIKAVLCGTQWGYGREPRGDAGKSIPTYEKEKWQLNARHIKIKEGEGIFICKWGCLSLRI